MKTLDKRGSYVLLSLGFLFAIGAAVRFLPSSFAIAENTSETQPGEAAEGDQLLDPSNQAVAVQPIDQVCFTDETAATLIADQKQMEALYEELTSQELDKRAADLDAIQQALAARWEEMQKESANDVTHLARMYGTMKPDQAAAIFNQMDPDFAGSFLRLMRSEQAGLILASMETRKAYEVSLRLAELNKDIREEAN